MVRKLKKTAVYIRVSSTSQDLASQRAEIQEWLDGQSITARHVEWFTDTQTGDNLHRPGFEELQAAIFKGQVGTVVVYKLDRLSRKMADGITTLSEWLDQGMRFVAV